MTRARKPKNGQEIAPAGAAIGRPTLYTQSVANEICERLSRDEETLKEICSDSHMPGLTTVYRWLRENDAFRNQYAGAREDQGHTTADAIGDYRRKVAKGLIPADVARAASDMAKWEAGRRASKYYGDKLQVETRNRTASAPIPTDASAQEAFRIYEEFVKGE